MDNVISFCWVIQDVEEGVQPFIYLTNPNVDSVYQKQFLFFNPFNAKKFIINDPKYAGKYTIKQSFEYQNSVSTQSPSEISKSNGGI